MQMKRGFEESLDCNNSLLAGSVNNLHLPFHTHNPMLIEVLSPSLQTWPHTSSVLVLLEHLSLQEAPQDL
jgi:hypothetical protein